jgi:ABC-type transporter MlaC component
LQDNGSDITFLWNGSEYEVGIDISQWQQNRSIAGFMSTVEQTYAWTLLHVSADTVGFTPNEQESNESQVKNKPKKLEIVENEQQILICKGWGK